MVQQLNLFDTLSEGRDVEFKVARGGLPRSVWETYSAFANTSGGTIYLGIKETDDGLQVQGVHDLERLLADFWSAINNRQKANENLLTDRDVEVLDVDGRQVVEIRVPRASRQHRPVYVGLDPYDGTYRRNHEGDFKCRRGEVQRMFADQSDAFAADSRILEYFSLDDFDAASIRQFRNRMASRQPNHPWLSREDIDFLTKLGAWRRDRSTGVEGPTVAGLLMFGQTQSITDNEVLPGFYLDYRERLADDESVRWSDRLTFDGTWEVNLFQFYMRIVQKLHNDNAIKTPFARDAEGYRKGETAVHEALQEALVNALIHADHTGQGGIIVERFHDHFEFSNPGTLLLSVGQLIQGGVSECRNKSLQTMFQMLGAGDRAGSGLDKIRASWRAQYWQSPSLQENFRPDRVKLVLPMVSLLPDGLLEALRQRFGAEVIRDLNEDEIQTLATATFEGEVTNQRLQSMLTTHRVDITQMLRGLVEKRLLRQHGKRRGAYYELEGGSIEASDGPNSAGRSDAGAVDRRALVRSPSSRNEFAAPRSEVDPAHSEFFPPHSDPEPAHKLSSESMNDVAASNLREQDGALQQIAESVAQRQRVAPKVMRQTILDLCRGRFLSLREIAALLHRDARNLRDRHVTDLVASGNLRLEYPELASHRQQRYTTANGGEK